MCRSQVDTRVISIQRTFGVDACLADEIVLLNGRGVRTESSCCGHDKTAGWILIRAADERLARSLGYDSRYLTDEEVRAEQGDIPSTLMLVRPLSGTVKEHQDEPHPMQKPTGNPDGNPWCSTCGDTGTFTEAGASEREHLEVLREIPCPFCTHAGGTVSAARIWGEDSSPAH